MKFAINGDIHGRTFWKESKDLIDDVDKVIFLGDYLSPYPDEGVSNDEAISNFKEILEFKKEYPEKVILLLGNHDLQVSHSLSICSCRTDYDNYDSNHRLYMDNHNLFDLFYQADDNGNSYLLSHAGISDGWVKKAFPDCLGKDDVLSKLNDLFNDGWSDDEKKQSIFIAKMSYISWYRGGMDWSGSIVWRDAREGISNDFGYQVFGHTMLTKPYVTSDFACLDCQRTIVLDLAEQEFQYADGTKIEIYNKK